MFIILFNSQCPSILTCKVHSKMRVPPSLTMIFKSLLLDPHLKNAFDRLSHCLKALRPFRECQLRLPLRCFFLQNYFSSDEDTGIIKISSISKGSLNVPH